MKKLVLTAVAMLTLTAAALAQGTMGGPGFRSSAAAGNVLVNSGISFEVSPTLGIRHWISESVGFDLGLGFASLSAEGGTPSVEADEGSGFAFDVGVPFAAKKWDKVTFILRPGVTYGTAEAKDKLATVPPTEFTSKFMAVSGEMEVEWMVADRLSISAATGIVYRSIKLEDNDVPASEAEVTGFETTGSNFTTLGFHVYLW